MHPDLKLVAGAEARADRDLAARLVVLHRVRQQVAQHLLDAGLVALHPGCLGAVIEMHRHADVAQRGGRGHHRRAMRHQRCQRHRGQGQTHHAGLDARDVEHVVDHLQQVPAGFQDLRNPGLLAAVDRATALQVEQLGEAQHGVQRGAQLMAHARQKLALGPVGVFGAQSALLGCFTLDLFGDVLDHRHQPVLVAAGAAQQAPVGAHLQSAAVLATQPRVLPQFRQPAAQGAHQRVFVVVLRVAALLNRLGTGHQLVDGVQVQRFSAKAQHVAQLGVGLTQLALQVGKRNADGGVVEDVAKALLALSQGGLGACTLSHLTPQLSGALGHNRLNAPGAAGHDQQQRRQHRRNQQAPGGEQPGVAVTRAGYVAGLGGDAQRPALATDLDLAHMVQDAGGALFATVRAGQPLGRASDRAVHQAPVQVAGRAAHGGGDGLLQAKPDKHHPSKSRSALCRRGVQRATCVECAVKHHTRLAIGKLLHAEP